MDNKIHEKLQALFAAYTASLPNKIISLENTWQHLSAHWNQEDLISFHRDIHSLCGSSGTYGHILISKAARKLEECVKQLLNKDCLSSSDEENVQQLLLNLKSAPLNDKKEQTSIAGIRSALSSKAIYVLDNSYEFTAELTANLVAIGYSVKVFNKFSDLRNTLEESAPVAVMVDAEYLEPDASSYLSGLQKDDMSVPLFATAKDGSLSTRLCVIRAGGCAFFQKPVDVSYLTKAIDQICGSIVSDPLRVLIVDDSQSLVDYYSLVLQEAGMETRAITDPMLLFDVLPEFRPNLILLDVYMPSCSGLELAAVLRQEILYASIPIVFLSTEDDRFKQLSALSFGGDDFLTKPIQPHHLVSAVRTRAERANILNSFMTRDSLTGLLNHTSVLQHLDIELARAQRNNLPLSFIMIDIDHFKSVNDTYGHPIGDRVIQRLSELLFTRLRKTDYIGRYGGEEFAVILPNSDAAMAMVLCEHIREQFMRIVFEAEKAEFRVTFSAGISTYPAVCDAKSLVSAADQALYKAKNQGRNREVLSEVLVAVSK